MKTDNSTVDYENYLKSWLEGISSEISFWDGYYASKGRDYNTSDKAWNEIVSYEPQFLLEEDLELNVNETKFLDVGSGPMSSCGYKTTKTNLNFTAIDPLASIYKKLKEKYEVRTKIIPETGMVENLSYKFQENTFDIIHMSNALDHSFDPMLGIWQMLYVCKPGGKIILKHYQNEAENENYQGFHQWNLSLDNGKFIIWRGNLKIDVNDVLGDYATIIETKIGKEKIEIEGEYNKIVIRKNKNVPLHFNENYPLLLEHFLDEICKFNYSKLENNKKKAGCTLLQKIFSIKNEEDRKIIRLLGIKIKLKRKSKQKTI